MVCSIRHVPCAKSTSAHCICRTSDRLAPVRIDTRNATRTNGEGSDASAAHSLGNSSGVTNLSLAVSGNFLIRTHGFGPEWRPQSVPKLNMDLTSETIAFAARGIGVEIERPGRITLEGCVPILAWRRATSSRVMEESNRGRQGER